MLEKKQRRSWVTTESRYILELSFSRDPCGLWDKSLVSSSELWGKVPLTDPPCFLPGLYSLLPPKQKVLWLSTPYFYSAHTQVKHYCHSQRTTSSIKGLEQLLLSIATIPPCCQHWGSACTDLLPKGQWCSSSQNESWHRWSIKKMSLAIWSCVDISAPKPQCHNLQQWGNTSPKLPKTDTPNSILTPSMHIYESLPLLWSNNCSHEPDFINCSYTFLCPGQ